MRFTPFKRRQLAMVCSGLPLIVLWAWAVPAEEEESVATVEVSPAKPAGGKALKQFFKSAFGKRAKTTEEKDNNKASATQAQPAKKVVKVKVDKTTSSDFLPLLPAASWETLPARAKPSNSESIPKNLSRIPPIDLKKLETEIRKRKEKEKNKEPVSKPDGTKQEKEAEFLEVPPPI